VNNSEARAVIHAQLARYRDRSYKELVALIGTEPFRAEIAEGAFIYQVEIEVMWDGDPGGDVRVFGSIDDGGWRAFVPLSDSFIKAPDGSFVDES
jgi:hypothetical protein